MYRNTWMEIDLAAIEENVRRIKQIAGKRLIAVVKADGYGCGDEAVLKAAMNAGAEMAAVSSADEAFILRNKHYEGPILILGHTEPEDAPLLCAQRISVPAYSLNWVKRVVQENCAGLRVHIKCDTGMNRIGFRSIEEIREAIVLLQNASCNVEGIFTHFACADTDPDMTQAQFEKFAAFVKGADYPFEWIHCDNSEATVSFKDDLSNACRIGISMYGVSETLKDLRHPVSLYSRVFLVKQVHAGETIGYGATYTAEEDEWIGTMPIGYADGFIRRNQGRKVYIGGQYCEIVGRVCMDQTMVKLPCPVKEGSLVEIFGPHIPIEAMAEDLDTIPYEILCLISDRVTRIYTDHGEVSGEENGRMKESEYEKTA